MGFTLGDVLFLTISIFGGLTAAWAGAVLAAIVFPERTHKASMDFENRPWLTFFIGLVTFVPLATLGIATLGIPLVNFFSIVLLLGLLGTAVLGSGGLARLIARRIDDQGGATSSYQAIAKGAALVCVAEFLPFLGWLFIFPYVLIASFGAGMKSIFKKHMAPEVSTSTEAQ